MIPSPESFLRDFIAMHCLGESSSRRSAYKLQRLLNPLREVLCREPLVADLNAGTLAALTAYQRTVRRCCEATNRNLGQYFRSVWRCAADLGLAPPVPRMVFGGGRPSSRRGILTPIMKERITRATMMRAYGHTWTEIARHFCLSPEAIRNWQKRFRQFWHEAYGVAIASAEEVLAQRTKQHLVEVGDLNWMADRAEEAGSLVVSDPPPEVTNADPTQHSVPSFLEYYVIPCCLCDAAPGTINYYRIVARRFAVVMGNPPLCQIDNLMLARYRDALKRLAARGRSGKVLSVNTVRSHLRTLQTILDKAGPAGRRCRDAAGYLAVAPWVRRPKAELGISTIVSDEVLRRCYEAASVMQRPDDLGIEPAAWWRALLITARYLGLRARTIFGMRFEHIDWSVPRVVLPPDIIKTRKTLVLPLPPVVREHLEAIRTDRETVFAWTTSLEMWRQYFRNLQTIAGLADDERFGLHALRRTAITQLWKISPASAQLVAGHGSPIMAQMYYVNTEEVLTEALRESTAVPFTAGGGDKGKAA